VTRLVVLFLACLALGASGCGAGGEPTSQPPSGALGTVGAASPQESASPAGDAGQPEGVVYGDGVTLEESVPVSQIYDDLDGYVGQRVRVEGLVTGVCEKRGCWLELAGDREFETIRVKVEDGVIVFPVSARGQYAVAEGVLSRIDYDVEEAKAYLAREAEESGQAFDPASVTAPLTVVQIAGTGAVIREAP